MQLLKSLSLHHGAQSGYQKTVEKRWRSLEFHPLSSEMEQISVMPYQKKLNALSVHLLKLKRFQSLVQLHASRYIGV